MNPGALSLALRRHRGSLTSGVCRRIRNLGRVTPTVRLHYVSPGREPCDFRPRGCNTPEGMPSLNVFHGRALPAATANMQLVTDAQPLLRSPGVPSASGPSYQAPAGVRLRARHGNVSPAGDGPIPPPVETGSLLGPFL